MNALGLVLTLVGAVLISALPRRLAIVPLLLGAAYITRAGVLEIGPATLTALHLLVVVGFVRVLARGESIASGLNNVDVMLMLWAVVLIATSVFHTDESWVFRPGMIWRGLGCYFLFRIFVQDEEDVVRVFRFLCVALMPLALLMLLEQSLGQSLFPSLGGYYSEVVIRDQHIRARGPFTHPLLAGTVGATCVPMALYVWKSHRTQSLIGFWSAAAIVVATASSGPILMVLSICLALLLWKVRESLRLIGWLAVVTIIALQLVMKDPVYFLLARIDLTGSSTGWHRAQLIRSSIEHLDEWWLAGTDYTRHWMPTGIYASERHSDITNQFLGMGVMGGLPLMLLFILALVAAFRALGRALRENEHAPAGHGFLIWTLGATLFGHVANFFAVQLFDQSIVFFYLTLAAVGAIRTRSRLLHIPPLPATQHCAAPRGNRIVKFVRARSDVTPSGASSRKL